MELLLKKEIQEIFLWLKMSFLLEKQSCKSLMFMYNMTLGELWSLEEFLEKIIQLGWFGTPTNCSLFLFNKLGMKWIRNHDGSWIKITSNSFCASKIVLVSNLFLWMFCEKILMLLIIMLDYYSQLSKLIDFWCSGVLGIFLSATSYWNGVSRKDICSNWLGVHLCNSDTWMSKSMVCSALSQVLVD